MSRDVPIRRMSPAITACALRQYLARAGIPCTQTTNIGDADIKGFELATVLRPAGGFSADASIGYLDFKYDRVAATSGVLLANRSIYTPRLTGAAGVQYEADLGGRGTLTPRFDLTYRSSVFTDVLNQPVSRLPGLALVNARLTWADEANRWGVTLSATDVLDLFYAESVNLRPAAPYFAASSRLGQPRQWQVSARRSF